MTKPRFIVMQYTKPGQKFNEKKGGMVACKEKTFVVIDTKAKVFNKMIMVECEQKKDAEESAKFFNKFGR